jgi:hypothetical protein
VKYVVRAASNDPSGEQNIAGTISVGGERQNAGREPVSDRQERRASHIDEEPVTSR